MTIDESANQNKPDAKTAYHAGEEIPPTEQNDEPSGENGIILLPGSEQNTPGTPANEPKKLADDTTAPLVRNPFIDVGEAAKTRPIITRPTEPLLDDEPSIRAALRCHVGARRERNEDSCFTFVAEVGGHFKMQPFGLFIVADGMGGHSDGHIASKVASRTAAHHILSHIYLPMINDDERVMQTPIQEVLETAVQKANKAVYEYDPEMDSGTTLTIALVLGRRLHVAHVGDSRLYLLANNTLEAITSDHSLVQRLQDVGQLTAEEATFYRYGHILLRAVGQSDEVDVDTYMQLLPKSGTLMLCSDGLSGFISNAEILEIMNQDVSIETIANGLFSAAMSVGGFDNITAVVVDFKL